MSTCPCFKTSKPGGPETRTRADDPRHALQENEGLADFWCLDDGDILCHPVLGSLILFDCNAGTGNRKKIDKTQKSSRLDSAPSVWKISEVRALATVPTAANINSWPKRMSFEPCTNAFSSVRIRRQSLPLCVNVEQNQFTFSRVHGPHDSDKGDCGQNL